MTKTRFKKLATVLTLIVLLTFSLASCRTAPVEPPVPNSTYPMTITDDTGRTVTIESKPDKIVSLAPSNTEILFALGLGDKVVGNTTYCDYPEEAKSVEKIGGFSDPSMEKIVSLAPDLLFGTTMHQKYLSDIDRLGLTIVLLSATSIDGVMDDIELVGQITGTSSQAGIVVAEAQAKVDNVSNALKDVPESDRTTVFYLMWDDPIMTVGPNTLISDVLTRAGGVNVASDMTQDYPTYSLEVLVTKDPDAIVYTKMGSGTGLDPETIKSKAGWESIAAVKNDRIYNVDDNLMSRPGPRIVDGLVETAKALYPDKFSGAGK